MRSTNLKVSILALLAASVATSQTKVDLGNQTRNVNFGNATSVVPFPTGASLPPTCTAGQMFFNTAAQQGQNVYECTSANAWVVLGTGGGSNTGVLSVSRNSASELAVGSNCSLASPCNYRIGAVVYQLAAAATLDTTGGSGQVYLYIDTQGTLTAAEASPGNPALTCTGCSVVSVTTPQFPSGSIPIGLWSVTSGAFSSGGTDERASLAGAPVINAGSNIAITQTAGSITISAVDASGLGGSGSGSGSGSGGGSSASAAGSGSELQYNNFGGFGAVSGSSVSGGTVLLGGSTPASATQSLLGLGQAITGGNPNGTVFGLNSPAAFPGDLVNIMANGNPVFILDHYGQIHLAGSSFLAQDRIYLNAGGYTSVFGNYAGAPGSSVRLMVLGTGASNQVQLGTGNNSALVLNGLGKTAIGSIAPAPPVTAAGADLLIQNATPATGSTLVQVQAGASQSTDLMQWINTDGTNGASVSAQGALRNLPFGSQPACAVATRGMFWHQQGASGTKDAVSVCAKDATDTYAWRTIF